jgi:hypothetical protein
MSKDKLKSVDVKFKGVLNFANLFDLKVSEKFGGDPKCGAQFSFPAGSKAHQVCQDAVDQLLKANGVTKMESSKKALREGEEMYYPAETMVLHTSTKKRPQVVDRDRSPITADDDKIWSGCEVNCVAQIWFQDNNYGKRINAELKAVQLVSQGERLDGARPVDVTEVFEDLEDL